MVMLSSHRCPKVVSLAGEGGRGGGGGGEGNTIVQPQLSYLGVSVYRWDISEYELWLFALLCQ